MKSIKKDPKSQSPHVFIPSWAVVSILVVLGSITYSSSLEAPFFFDDISAIVQNPNLRHLWPLKGALFSPSQTPLAGRPVASLTFTLNYAAGGLSVRGYHAVNICLHVSSALLLFVILRKTWKLHSKSPSDKGFDDLRALVASSIWLVHPLQSEAVAYVTQRTELLVGFFSFLTLYCSLRYWESRNRGWMSAALGACVAGMGSKEVMAAIPFVILLYDRTFISESIKEALRKSRTLYSGLAASWLILLFSLLSGARSASAGFGLSISPIQYLRISAGAILHYLKLMLWPSSMILGYEVERIPTWTEAMPALLAIFGLLVLCAWSFTHHPKAAFSLATAFLFLAPTSSIIPIVTEVVAERRMYLPLAALLALVVSGCSDAVQRLSDRPWSTPVRQNAIFMSMWSPVILLLCLLCRDRVNLYRDEYRIWNDTLLKQPNNSAAHNNLGLILAEQGKYREAANHYEQSIRVQPRFPDVHNNLGNAYTRLGMMDRALEEYKKALEIKPDSIEIYHNLGAALKDVGRYAEAAHNFEKALALNPDLPETLNALGSALINLGRIEEGKQHIVRALEIDPNMADAHENLGIALARLGRPGEAILHYLKALELTPGIAAYHNNLGLALAESGRLNEAESEFLEAIKLDPSFSDAFHNLGMAFLEDKNSERAIEVLSKSLRLNPGDVVARQTLERLRVVEKKSP